MSVVAPDDSDIEKIEFQVAYDGAALANHLMSVQQLAPALLGLDQLINEMNNSTNGERSRVQLFVASEFEHKCFSINFEALQIIYENIKSLLKDDDIRSLREILEWIGLLGAPRY